MESAYKLEKFAKKKKKKNCKDLNDPPQSNHLDSIKSFQRDAEITYT